MSGLNRGPEITGAGAYEVAENTARVGRLEAVDGDDEIGGYGIAGGADGGLFAVEAGELLFREAPDYETPGDVASDDPESGAADNEYIVVVEVRSGEGGAGAEGDSGDPGAGDGRGGSAGGAWGAGGDPGGHGQLEGKLERAGEPGA